MLLPLPYWREGWPNLTHKKLVISSSFQKGTCQNPTNASDIHRACASRTEPFNPACFCGQLGFHQWLPPWISRHTQQITNELQWGLSAPTPRKLALQVAFCQHIIALLNPSPPSFARATLRSRGSLPEDHQPAHYNNPFHFSTLLFSSRSCKSEAI